MSIRIEGRTGFIFWKAIEARVHAYVADPIEEELSGGFLIEHLLTAARSAGTLSHAIPLWTSRRGRCN